MPVKQGLIDSLNAVREESTNYYQQNIPLLSTQSLIEEISGPLLSVPKLMNEFISGLVQRIVYTKFQTKTFNNKLKILEGDGIPNGYIGQEIYINPAKGRDYDVNDFAGLLKKYESDVKVQYPTINYDKQYPVTVVRNKLKQAFVSWNDLETFIGNLTNSLYNGAYIDQYRATLELIANAYKTNTVQIQKIDGINTEDLAKQFITLARTLFLNFQTPSSQYNAWKKVGGYGRDIITWSDPQDVVFIIRNDIQAYLDVNVLAQAFNISSSELLGRIITVDNFNIYNMNGEMTFDGSSIYGMIADASWFRIKTQDEYMEDFRNPNNRSLQYYLNVTKMYQYSFFANAVVFASEEPQIQITGLDFNTTGVTIENVGDQEGLDINVLPKTANTPEIQYASANNQVFTVKADENNNRHCILTATGVGESNLTATAGGVQTQITVTVKNPAIMEVNARTSTKETTTKK